MYDTNNNTKYFPTLVIYATFIYVPREGHIFFIVTLQLNLHNRGGKNGKAQRARVMRVMKVRGKNCPTLNHPAKILSRLCAHARPRRPISAAHVAAHVTPPLSLTSEPLSRILSIGVAPSPALPALLHQPLRASREHCPARGQSARESVESAEA